MTAAAVVFDIGNVLIEWNPRRWYAGEIGASAAEAFFAEVPIEAMNLAVDRGADLSASVEALAARHPAWAREIRWWRDRWLEICAPAIPASVRLLERLRARGVPVYALTNFGRETFEIARPAYPFLDAFDRAFVSGHLGLLKPEPGIYAAVEQGTGHPPERLLFTDDRPENVAAAAARGWRAHLFDGPAGFAERLVAEGLIAREEAA
jgi:2-haloacid dehalogenase